MGVLNGQDGARLGPSALGTPRAAGNRRKRGRRVPGRIARAVLDTRGVPGRIARTVLDTREVLGRIARAVLGAGRVPGRITGGAGDTRRVPGRIAQDLRGEMDVPPEIRQCLDLARTLDVIPANAGRRPRERGNDVREARGQRTPEWRGRWIPAFAGMTSGRHEANERPIPAFAGMTGAGDGFPLSRE